MSSHFPAVPNDCAGLALCFTPLTQQCLFPLRLPFPVCSRWPSACCVRRGGTAPLSPCCGPTQWQWCPSMRQMLTAGTAVMGSRGAHMRLKVNRDGQQRCGVQAIVQLWWCPSTRQMLTVGTAVEGIRDVYRRSVSCEPVFSKVDHFGVWVLDCK